MDRSESNAPSSHGADDLERDLLDLVEQARQQASEDPFRNPVLTVALAISRRFDRGEITEGDLEGLFRRLRQDALGERAARLRAYVGLGENGTSLDDTATLVLGDPAAPFEEARARLERPRFAAVFTAHPTFGMSQAVANLLAEAASVPPEARAPLLTEAAALTARPDPVITLDDEFDRARHGVQHGRAALDRLNAAVLRAARERWPEHWHGLVPRPVVLASWVGCDTDGRTDIDWWDTLRYRLESKRTQFDRVLDQLPADPAAEPARRLAQGARDAVVRQLAAAPKLGDKPGLEVVHRFALALIIERERAQTEVAPLLALLDRAVAEAADDEARLALCVLRAGCAAHGLQNGLPHFRLNASQVHNAVRRALDHDGEPTDPAQRRSHLASINELLDHVAAVPVDFGALAAERASAARLMMTIAQILKHVDGSHPVRFLIAETETGYTLLAALWLAEHFGIGDKVEITPLFETASALEQGLHVVEDALRSAHWRRYLRRLGRLVLQFGYSDSGRYVGQIAATFWIERLRLRVTELMVANGLTDIELVIFDTHGESIGRGAHPESLSERLAYLAPTQARRRNREAGIQVRLESSFQGSDGYLLFGTPALAEATVQRIAEHVYSRLPDTPDPIYAEPDFATEFFTGMRQDMQTLVDDPGYAALLGTFGPNLIDRTGSRPVARQSDGGGPAAITHPRQMRAIPNNAILQQLGFLANSLHGLGRAAGRAPDLFNDMRGQSERFGRAFSLARHAAAVSDLDVLRAYVDTLDPGMWLERARRATRDGRREEIIAIAAALDRLNLAPRLRRLFGRLTHDHLRLQTVATDLSGMGPRLTLLHGLRIALIHRIWFLAVHIPGFRPQAGVTREVLIERILRLDVEACLKLLDEIFPVTPDPTLGLNFGEPAGPRGVGTYEAEHRTLFAPIGRLFAQVREISGMIQHEVGAFG
ncbi:MAG: phosphoenolpyruvate carboxylase [Methylobacterium frigidaeris]